MKKTRVLQIRLTESQYQQLKDNASAIRSLNCFGQLADNTISNYIRVRCCTKKEAK